MADWYVYDWELQGLPAQFHVDLKYVDEFDTLGDFTTLLYISCYPKKAESQAFSAHEKRALENVSRECLRILGEHCAFVGFIGLGGDPSPAVDRSLGNYAVMLYSTILVVSGLIGAIGIFRSVQATVISVWVIAAATFFHGAAAWADNNPQTGLRLMVAPLMMVPLVWVWGQWLRLIKHTTRLEFRPRKR